MLKVPGALNLPYKNIYSRFSSFFNTLKSKFAFLIKRMAHTMIKIETAPLKIGKTISRSNIVSSPHVANIVFVNVTMETLAEIKLITFTQE